MTFGAYLVEQGVLSPGQLDDALCAQRIFGGRLGLNLVELGFLPLGALEELLARRTGFDLAPAAALERIPRPTLQSLPADLVGRRQAIPFRVESRHLHVAVCDPAEEGLAFDLSVAAPFPVRLFLTSELRIRTLLERHYRIPRPIRFRSGHRQAVRPEPVSAGLAVVDCGPALSGEAADQGPAAGVGSDVVAPVEPPAPDLSGCADRDAVADAALRFASEHVSAAALFVVSKGRIRFWRAVGLPLTEEAIERVALSDPADPAFRDRLAAVVGRSGVSDSRLLPVLVRGRVVNLLYADNGRAPFPPGAAGRLEAVTRQMGAVYERIVLDALESRHRT